MEPMKKRKALIAIDLGAQSCRVSLLRFWYDEPAVDVVHRFGISTRVARLKPLAVIKG